ncbi:hypothetical protein BC936DRAFT_148979, partial [Jimgerdemannia flammicorona]
PYLNGATGRASVTALPTTALSSFIWVRKALADNCKAAFNCWFALFLLPVVVFGRSSAHLGTALRRSAMAGSEFGVMGGYVYIRRSLRFSKSISGSLSSAVAEVGSSLTKVTSLLDVFKSSAMAGSEFGVMGGYVYIRRSLRFSKSISGSLSSAVVEVGSSLTKVTSLLDVFKSSAMARSEFGVMGGYVYIRRSLRFSKSISGSLSSAVVEVGSSLTKVTSLLDVFRSSAMVGSEFGVRGGHV